MPGNRIEMPVNDMEVSTNDNNQVQIARTNQTLGNPVGDNGDHDDDSNERNDSIPPTTNETTTEDDNLINSSISSSDNGQEHLDPNSQISFPKAVIPGCFDNYEVYIVNPEILTDRNHLNYKGVENMTNLTKAEKREVKRKVVQIATLFYNINNDLMPANCKKISLTSVAKFFGIPRQSFNDHIKGTHLNSAIYGSPNKSFLTDNDTIIIRNLIASIQDNTGVSKPIDKINIPDKILKAIIELFIEREEMSLREVNYIASAIHSLRENQFKLPTANDLTKLNYLLFLQEVLSDDFNGKLSSDIHIQFSDMENILDEVILIKKNFTNDPYNVVIKRVSRRTVSRAKKRIGLHISPNSIKESEKNSDAVRQDSAHVSPTNIIQEKSTSATTPVLTSTEIPPNSLSTRSSTTRQRLNPPLLQEAQSKIDVLNNIITDEDITHDTLSKMTDYRRYCTSLLDLVSNTEGETLEKPLITHMRNVSDLILRLLFENVRLRKNEQRRNNQKDEEESTNEEEDLIERIKGGYYINSSKNITTDSQGTNVTYSSGESGNNKRTPSEVDEMGSDIQQRKKQAMGNQY